MGQFIPVRTHFLFGQRFITTQGSTVNHVTEQTVMAGMLLAICAIGEYRSQAGTNDLRQDASVGTNASETNDWVCVAPQLSWHGDKDTNGWSSLLYISNDPWHSGERPPMCGVSIKNTTTNRLSCWIGFYGETYSRIELFDSKGEAVAKTIKGSQINTRTSITQIKEMLRTRYNRYSSGRSRTPGFVPIRPGQTCGIAFSILDLFEVKQPGEYTLKAQTCLIQRVGGELYDPELRITWPPPVTAKFQLREKVVPAADSPLKHINAPAR